jgi:hypothetical protein
MIKIERYSNVDTGRKDFTTFLFVADAMKSRLDYLSYFQPSLIFDSAALGLFKVWMMCFTEIVTYIRSS